MTAQQIEDSIRTLPTSEYEEVVHDLGDGTGRILATKAFDCRAEDYADNEVRIWILASWIYDSDEQQPPAPEQPVPDDMNEVVAELAQYRHLVENLDFIGMLPASHSVAMNMATNRIRQLEQILAGELAPPPAPVEVAAPPPAPVEVAAFVMVPGDMDPVPDDEEEDPATSIYFNNRDLDRGHVRCDLELRQHRPQVREEGLLERD